MGCQTGGLNIDDDKDLADGLKEVAGVKVPLAVHAEDKDLLTKNEEKLKQAKKNGLAAFQEAHSEAVELKAIKRLLKISAPADLKLHFCHVSTEEGLNAIVEAKKTGRKITCEVTPNHLLLSSADLVNSGQLLIMAPPLRNKNHVESLWKGLEAGWIDSLGSDHAPHSVKREVCKQRLGR